MELAAIHDPLGEERPVQADKGFLEFLVILGIRNR
jgi:hypothetical protein